MKLYRRQDGCCFDCGKTYSETELTFHHEPPKNKGGTNDSSENILLCLACHKLKLPNDKVNSTLYICAVG